MLVRVGFFDEATAYRASMDSYSIGIFGWHGSFPRFKGEPELTVSESRFILATHSVAEAASGSYPVAVSESKGRRSDSPAAFVSGRTFRRFGSESPETKCVLLKRTLSFALAPR